MSDKNDIKKSEKSFRLFFGVDHSRRLKQKTPQEDSTGEQGINSGIIWQQNADKNHSFRLLFAELSDDIKYSYAQLEKLNMLFMPSRAIFQLFFSFLSGLNFKLTLKSEVRARFTQSSSVS